MLNLCVIQSILKIFLSLDNKSAGRQSVASNLTKPDHEEDADSMAEYGEGDTGKFGYLFRQLYGISLIIILLNLFTYNLLSIMATTSVCFHINNLKKPLTF